VCKDGSCETGENSIVRVQAGVRRQRVEKKSTNI
jgi:hypothetical protein